MNHGVYGFPPSSLADIDANAAQYSPLVPQSLALEKAAPESLESLVMLAPPGTIERRYAMAAGLRAVRAGGTFTVMALNKKGGTRLSGELKEFGCESADDGRQHHRICVVKRPARLQHIEDAISAGSLQKVESTGLWSQAGVFSWNKLDVGSALLVKYLPALSGKGADLGSGVGFLARAVLASPKVTELALVEIDRRAVEAAQRNVVDTRATFVWQDAREAQLSGLDFVVMNPPFHDTGMEDQSLGKDFIEVAAASLRKQGVCYMVANRHLPYESTLHELFGQVTTLAEADGFKVIEAKL